MPILLQSIKKRLDFLKISKKGEKKFTKGFILQKIKRNDLSFTDKFNVFKDEIKNVVINFEKANKLNHILKLS